MREFQQFGIVLRAIPVREADLLLTILTSHQGRISATARAARKSQKRFAGGCDLLDCGKFTLTKKSSNGFLSVSGIEDRRSWGTLRENLDSFLCGSYCAELALLFALENDPEASNYLKPLFKTLQALERESSKEAQLSCALYFHLVVLQIAGLSVTDHPNYLQDVELRAWLKAMLDAAQPITPFNKGLLPAAFQALVRFTNDETGEKLRSYPALMQSMVGFMVGFSDNRS